MHDPVPPRHHSSKRGGEIPKVIWRHSNVAQKCVNRSDIAEALRVQMRLNGCMDDLINALSPVLRQVSQRDILGTLERAILQRKIPINDLRSGTWQARSSD